MTTKKQLSLLYAAAYLLFTNPAWSTTSEFSKIAEDFFVAARLGTVEATEKFISPQWLSEIEPAQFKRFLKVLSLNDYQSALWDKDKDSTGINRLKGELTTSDSKFTVTFNFIKHDGRWLINGISVAPSTPPVKLPVPDYDAVVILIQSTMNDFADSVNKRNMNSFYDTTSTTFRIRHAPEELGKTFAQFYGEDDFSDRVAAVPGLAKPTFEKGYLTIHGGYEGTGFKTDFKIVYATEEAVWKVISFAIRSEPVK